MKKNMKKAWIVLPLLLAVTGLLLMGCGDANEDDNKGKAVQSISLSVMNGSAQTANTLPKQLPPGARVVVSANVTVKGGASKAFTVTVDKPTALDSKITVTDSAAVSGAKQIDIATDITVDKATYYEYQWITVTVTSTGDTSKTDVWKFIVWGDAVTQNNSFAVNDAQLSKLPNCTVADADKYEDSVAMSDRFRLAGYPVQVFRPDTEAGKELENECAEYNGSGYIIGEELEILRNAVPGSLVRLYFNCAGMRINSDNETYIDDQVKGGWGVVKFGDDNTTYNAPASAMFYIDASVDAALEAMAANHQDELYVNVFNAQLLKIELWEVLRPLTWTSKGKILEQTVGATVTMENTGDYADAHALMRAANDGSYLRITMESPEVRPGWGVAQIGGSSTYYTVPVTNPTTLENGWVRFTVDMDLWTMIRNSNWTPPLAETNSVRFNTWDMTTSNTGSDLEGRPIFISVELFAIDD